MTFLVEMGGQMVKKNVLILVFIALHLIVTRFAIRIVDAMVKIDGNLLALIGLVLVLNAALFFIFRAIYKRIIRKN